MLVLFVVFPLICFMQTLLCCGLYELGLQVCVQTSCSSDSLTSVFNLFNPLSLARSLSLRCVLSSCFMMFVWRSPLLLCF